MTAYAVCEDDVVDPASVARTPLGAAVNWLWSRHGIMTSDKIDAGIIRNAFVNMASRSDPPAYVCEIAIEKKARLTDEWIVESPRRPGVPIP